MTHLRVATHVGAYRVLQLAIHQGLAVLLIRCSAYEFTKRQ